MPAVRRASQRFGAHMSIAGGLHRAVDAASRAGCDCLQVFVKNQRQWTAKRLVDEDVQAWKKAVRKTRIRPAVAHASYLPNLATTNDTNWRRSLDALQDELDRCEALEIPYLVFHPGSHLEASPEQGMRRIARGINRLHDHAPGYGCMLLLETTAGQGTALGRRFEELAAILDQVREPERLGICLDTCHVFAAGYALSPADGYDATMDALIRHVGARRVKCFHVNDSKKELGSRVDRHTHIGEGCIGLDGFRRLLNDPRFVRVPRILETPKGQNDRGQDLDLVNLRKLRRLVRK